MKFLDDGERRVMQPARWLTPSEAAKVQVTAVHIDSETPYVVLRIGQEEVWCSDTLASDLIDRVKRALNILPSSK